MRRVWLAGSVAAGLAFIALASRFAIEHSNPVFQDGMIVFPVSGALLEGYSESGGVIRFDLSWGRSTMLVASADPELLQTLDVARDAGEPITVRNHLAGAHFDPDTGQPVFWVESLEYRNQKFGPYQPRVPWSWRVMVDEQVALLRGIALQGNQDLNGALTDFDRSLASQTLEAPQRGLALALRGEVYERKAAAEPRQIGRDFLYLRAIEDYAAAAKLRPGDASLLTSRAVLLGQLGAHEDALAVLERVPREPREIFFRAGIMKSEVLRKLHRYPEALSALDAIQDEPDMGMMFHYHRGVTLLLLGRHPEAAAAFADGLKSQRGWQWAYVGRACARHFMNDDDSAVLDLRTAVEIADRAVDKDDHYQSVMRAELRNNIRRLEAFKKGEAPVPLTICERFEPDFEGPPRERSKLLDKT